MNKATEALDILECSTMITNRGILSSRAISRVRGLIIVLADKLVFRTQSYVSKARGESKPQSLCLVFWSSLVSNFTVAAILQFHQTLPPKDDIHLNRETQLFFNVRSLTPCRLHLIVVEAAFPHLRPSEIIRFNVAGTIPLYTWLYCVLCMHVLGDGIGSPGVKQQPLHQGWASKVRLSEQHSITAIVSGIESHY